MSMTHRPAHTHTQVVFFPCFVGGAVDPRTLHQATPARDLKYVCQIWVRESAVPIETGAAASKLGHRLLDALHAPL